MKIAYLGSYPPRNCGIATFTRSLFESVNRKPGADTGSFVVAMEGTPSESFPSEVAFTIRENIFADYARAAEFVNESGASVCCIQHEYGIFGGELGSFVLHFAAHLRVPLIVTFHTVLKEPSEEQRIVAQELARMSRTIVVMNQTARDYLCNSYQVPATKIMIIPHGFPEFSRVSSDVIRKKLNLRDYKVLMTFGLLSRNKGIETVIRALPSVVKTHPDLVYLVVGKTHPNVVREEGENYRAGLIELACELGVEKHLQFVDRFVPEDELFEYLQAADFYITPYLNEAQITSGTLAYALGAGCVVLSTPYWHAREVLSDGKGVLFPFCDDQALAANLNDLMLEENRVTELREKVAQFSNTRTWPRCAARYISVFNEAINNHFAATFIPEQKQAVPEISLDHLERLTDRTGLMQHARYGIPDYREGYCIDDNARALLFCSLYRGSEHKGRLEVLAGIYLSFINYMQTTDGKFRNFLPFSRGFDETCGSEDSFGRTVWALGSYILKGQDLNHVSLANELFLRACNSIEALTSPRAIANCMLGLADFIQSGSGHQSHMDILENMASRLLSHYKNTAGGDWCWFEDALTYDNALLPLAMYVSGDILDRDDVLQVAEESSSFLTRVSFRTGFFSPVGNDGWYHRGRTCAMYSQQPIDAMMQILLHHYKYITRHNESDREKMHQVCQWFLGDNIIRQPLVNVKTGSCYDGIEEGCINRNMGAESTLAWLISAFLVGEAESSAGGRLNRQKANRLENKKKLTEKTI